MRNRFSRPALLIALVLAAACAPARAGGAGAYATVVIENDSPSMVTIYALRGSSRMRLGTVSGLGSERFPLRWDMLGPGGELRLLIDPLGGRQNYPAQRITVNEGDVIELRVSSFVR